MSALANYGFLYMVSVVDVIIIIIKSPATDKQVKSNSWASWITVSLF